MNLQQFFGLIYATFLSLYYWLEAVFRFFVPPPRKDVRGDIVLVTGAGSGIGQRLSVEFAKLGCIVVGWDISEAGLDETKHQLTELGLDFKWHSCKCDLSDRHQVYDASKKLKSEVGEVSILVNNAGIVTGKRLTECHDELMIKTMEINTMAHFWTIKAFLPSMMERNHGHVVTIASGAGLFGLPGQVDYAASKFGAVGLTEALDMELRLQNLSGVKTTVVCPYYIDTGMFKGVSTPIIPIIKAKYAVDQIVDAVLRNKAVLLMPRLVYIMYALKGLLPVKTAFVLSKATGAMESMNTFVGRS